MCITRNAASISDTETCRPFVYKQATADRTPRNDKTVRLGLAAAATKTMIEWWGKWRLRHCFFSARDWSASAVPGRAAPRGLRAAHARRLLAQGPVLRVRNMIIIIIMIICFVLTTSSSSSSSSSTQRFGLWPLGKTHMFEKPVQTHWKTQYVWQIPFPKTIHKITTNIKHQNQPTFEDNNENTLFTKSSAESDSIFQTKGSKTFGERTKTHKTTIFKLL